jgi:acyl carrier protein
VSAEAIFGIVRVVLIVGIVAFTVGWLVRIARAHRLMWQEWCRRQPVDDLTFLVDCGFAPDAPSAMIALEARRGLAEATGVPPETIRADDPFADPFWDSIDWLDILFRIEKRIAAKLPGPVLEKAAENAGGDLRRIPVRDFIAAVAASQLRPLRGRDRPPVTAA